MRNILLQIVGKLALVFATLFVTTHAIGQSTISDRPFELTSSGGLWVPLLPDYQLGVNANGGTAYRDSLDEVGGIGRIRAVRRWLDTRTSFEATGFYAMAESKQTTALINTNVPDAVTGIAIVSGANQPRLSSEIASYGGDIGLRDTWQTPWGGLSAGSMFSVLSFDQSFDVDAGATDLFREDLDSRFRGGKAVFGWDGYLKQRPTNLDLGIGIYDLNAEYTAVGDLIPGRLDLTEQETAVTIETSFTTRKEFQGIEFGVTFGVLYISEMPTIDHNVGVPATVSFDDAVTVSAMLEILLF